MKANPSSSVNGTGTLVTNGMYGSAEASATSRTSAGRNARKTYGPADNSGTTTAMRRVCQAASHEGTDFFGDRMLQPSRRVRTVALAVPPAEEGLHGLSLCRCRARWLLIAYRLRWAERDEEQTRPAVAGHCWPRRWIRCSTVSRAQTSGSLALAFTD